MEYTLKRSGRRTLAIEITRECEIIVRAPRRCPQGEIDRFLNSRADWLAEHTVRQKQRQDARPEPDQTQREALIIKAKAELPARLDYYAKLMALSPAGISITGAKKRFGSCSPTNRLCFSWRLMQYPIDAVDYVVVHELAHIVQKNHGPQFYALVASVLPDYKARWKQLKE